MVNRRSFLKGGGAAVALLGAPFGEALADGGIRTVDVLGREVALRAPARRIVVGTSMNLDALALAHPDPAGLIAGWSGLVPSMGETQKADLLRRLPRLAGIPVVGRLSGDDPPLEAIVALRPDLVLLNLHEVGGHITGGEEPPAIQRLTALGIPVVVVDFFVDPLANSIVSLGALGVLFGTQGRVAAFLDQYRARLAAVRSRIDGAAGVVRPTVFMHAHAAGEDCCYSPGRGALNGFIELAGGHNIGADALATTTGQLSLEYVLSREPDVYLATAGYTRGSASGFTLGRGVAPEEAREGFERLLGRPELAAVAAIPAGRAYGIWHDFAQSPLHVVAIEAMAKWFHPELFADLDPSKTLMEMNARFTSIPLEGTFWVSRCPSVKATTP